MKRFSQKKNSSTTNASSNVLTRPIIYSRRRVRIGLFITVTGFLVFVLGARPNLYGLDRSPVIGFVQIAVFLIGLALICFGGYISLFALWKYQRASIAADIGMRLVATGYVVAVFAGMADVFGFGSHQLPVIPYFGPWQARGVEFGELLIGVGFLMMIPYRDPVARVANQQDDEPSTEDSVSAALALDQTPPEISLPDTAEGPPPSGGDPKGL
jgi:hypothetical protein